MNKYVASINTVILEQLKNASFRDKNYQELVHQIKVGFLNARHIVSPVLRPFWEGQHLLTSCDNIISMNDKLVIPTSLQKKILHTLDLAHQGVANMAARANVSVYWPGINNSIRTT